MRTADSSTWLSRPMELHYRPLTEPSVRLLPHSAPIRQTLHASRSSCSQLFRSCNRLTRPLCSSPITEPSSLVRVRPPQCSALVLSPRRFWAACASPLSSERLVPAVPCYRLHPSHALSTPVATRPVIRLLTGSSQVRTMHLVSTTLGFLTTRLRKVHFRSALECSPARVLSRFSSNAHHRRLLIAAAWRWFETCS
jgi:hypothetical protein